MKTTIRKYADTCHSYIRDNVDVSYVKYNLFNILFQLWFSPIVFLAFAQGTYYENNNDFKLIEYIRNYEIVNLLLEYFYLNPFVVRSTMILHHIVSVLIPITIVQLQHENIPIMQTFIFLGNITVTTNILLDLAKIFHKNIFLKIIFAIYYFMMRIITPLPFMYKLTTGYYLYVTPSENIPVTICLSVGGYILYGLNLFWFYKICNFARKLIK